MHLITVALVTWLGFLQPGPDPAGMRKPPTFTASLRAATDALTPGGSTELAIVLDVQKNWHIYHPIMLDTGLPTTFRFSGPPGVTLGEIRFPAPTLANLKGIEYLEMSGQVICTVPITLDSSFKPGTPLKLRVDVDARACIEECVKVKASASLTIPISDQPGSPANDAIFKAAREKFPPALGDADHIKGSKLEMAAATFRVHDKGELAAIIKIAPGKHIQDRDPGVDGLIGSRLYIEKIDGVTFVPTAKQIWPAPTTKLQPGIGNVREQRGDILIRVPFELTDEKFPAGPVRLRVLFEYQACNDTGTCFAPTMAEAFVTFTADTPTPAKPASLYKVVDDAAALDVPKAPQSTGSPDASGGAPVGTTLWYALLTAFLGGLVLNVMPCVLPVISLKVLSFMQQGGEQPGRVFRLGLAFCGGIMVWFWIFAFISTRSTFQLQDPRAVIAIASILYLMALSLFDVFEFTLPGATAGSLEALTAREGYSGAFLKGLLATLLGTACTAPFLGAALAFASTQPAVVAFSVFSAAGLGMSAPYLLLVARPSWLKYVPKPGNWMVVFKEGMGFLLIGTAVWLLYVLGQQTGSNGVVVTLVFWSFLSLAGWIWGLIKPNWSGGGRWSASVAAVLLALLGYNVSFQRLWSPNPAIAEKLSVTDAIKVVSQSDWKDRIPWVPYTRELAAELSRAGYTVYVDYTASWCVNCQVNKGIALEIESTRALMREMHVIPIEADYTNPNADMTADIQKFQRNSVPLNLIFSPGKPDDPTVLPVLLTPGIVQDALRQAGPSTAVAKQLAGKE